ncbi:MAG: undecaprenyl-diphosphate phosphatase [Flavobacteriales bacterium]|nr:undecaprenyl-diphosphate phosphatase [Flavobacteriales bacterium]
MSLIEAILLGIIQGLTEFLPVSSSGHLELAKFFLGDDSVPKESLIFDVVLHSATALSTIVIFWKDILKIFRGLMSTTMNEEKRFALFVVVSMIPAAAIGVLFDDLIEAMFNKQVLLVGLMLIVTGLLLFLADRAKKTDKKLTFSTALIIGISQAIAILPGISRSGATISTSVLLGIDKETAAKFSFLMVIPLIFGKMAKDMMSGDLDIAGDKTGIYIAGFVAAFIMGLLACKLMINLVKKSKLVYFSIYCFIVGPAAILLWWFL